jgi:glycosyltransferase involved in cell wall biosynthesis
MGMRILIVTQYFSPESFRINELVESLVERGEQVHVLTGKPNYPEGKIFQGYHALGTVRETWHGANLYRVPMAPRGFRNGIRLFLNYLSFSISATVIGAWMLRRVVCDVIFVYAASPILIAFSALFIGWLKRVPVVVYVQDLWPESLEATGYVKNQLAIRCVELLVRSIYRNSDLILVSSRPFISSIQRFSPSAEVIYYPNSVDANFCDPSSGLQPEVPALRTGFNVVFAGNVGAAQAVHVIIEAASMLKEHPEIRFVVLGSGSELKWMREQIKIHGLNNITLAGRFPVQSMPSLLALADVLLVTLTDREIFAATVPNKIQAYMAVGRPVIAAMNGEGARLVQEAKAGISVPAEDALALADAIVTLYAMSPSMREELGRNAQTYYRQHFDHEKLVTMLQAHLVKVKKAKQ